MAQDELISADPHAGDELISADPGGAPFDVKKQNATMRANMAKQPGEAELQARAVSEPWTTAAMRDRAVQGVKGEAVGFGGGLIAAPVALATAVRHPIDTAKGALALGAGGYKLATDPAARAAAGDAVTGFMADPEKVGGLFGGAAAAEVAPPVYSFARNTGMGQKALEVAEALPGAGRVVKTLVPSNKTIGTTAQREFSTAMTARDARSAADQAYDARMAGRDVVPVGDASATSPARMVATVEKRNAYGVHPGETDDEAVRRLVVSTADANAANPSIARATDSRPVLAQTLGRTPAEVNAAADADTAGRVIPLADESGRSLLSHAAPIPGKRTPIVSNVGPRELSEPGLFTETPAPGAFGAAPPSTPSPRQLGDLTVVGNNGEPIAGIPAPARPRVHIDANGNVIVPDGSIPVASKGLEATMTAEERALIGNRGKGALPLAERQKLLNALLARAKGVTP